MTFTNYILQSNIYPLIVLVIVFVSLLLSKDFHVRDSRSFKTLILLTATLLLGEIGIMVAASGTSSIHIFFHNLLNIISFIALPGAAFTWVIYVLREAGFDFKKNRLTVGLILSPLVITGVLAGLSALFGFYFHIGADNVYQRGNLFFVHAIISYSYLAIGLFFIIKNRKSLARREFFSMLIFAVPPTLGGILQMAFYGLHLINPSMAISVLLIFLFNQNQQVFTDYLTGLNNRRQNEKFIAQLKPKSGSAVGVMLLDLDQFKQINDTYGHFLGDEVLVAIASILNATFEPTDFIARTGGDEFNVFFNVTKTRTVNHVIKLFLDRLNEFNSRKVFPFDIKCSYGIDVFDPSKYNDIREFLVYVDQLMYRQKARK